MNQHPIGELTENALKNLRTLVDVNAIIGDPITAPSGTVIIPVSKVSFGFGTGGSDFPSQSPKEMFGGGTGGGVTIQPLAFLVMHKDGKVQLLQMASANNTADRIVNMVPDVVDKVSAFFAKDKTAEATVSEEFI